MDCPKCGYVMTDLDVECPRCKVLGNRAPATPPSQPLPALQPDLAPAAKPAKPLVVAAPGRSGVPTWALVAVGMAIVLLLGALVVMQLRKSTSAGGVAEAPQTQAPAATTPGDSLASQPQTQQPGATTGAGGLAQGQQGNVPPATTPAGGLAQSQQQGVPPATTNADDLARGQQQQVPAATTEGGTLADTEEQYYDPRTVRKWTGVYTVRGSGMFTTPPIPVRRPWRIRYYTGVRPDNDLALDTFAIFPGTGSLETPVVSVSQPNYEGWTPALKRGPVVLSIVTMFNNWMIIVDQGEF